jgi:hypothetical protein
MLIAALGLVIAACGGDDDGGDIVEPSRTTPGPAYIESVDFTFLESDPVQVRAEITGNLPTPCHLLDIAQNGDTVAVISLYDPREACDQVLQPFATTVDLGPTASGAYTLVVNGEPYPYTVGDPTGDEQITGPVYVDGVEFIFLESYPVQVRAIIRGSVPTPCHTAQAVVGERDGNRVPVTISSTAPADAVCAQVLEPFELTVAVGSFETGDYVVEIGGVDYPFTI